MDPIENCDFPASYVSLPECTLLETNSSHQFPSRFWPTFQCRTVGFREGHVWIRQRRFADDPGIVESFEHHPSAHIFGTKPKKIRPGKSCDVSFL